MTIAEFAGRAEDWLTLIALLGAVWSAYAFVRSKLRERIQSNEDKLFSWRKASIQQLMMTSPDWLTTEQITQHLRSSSYDGSFDINKAALTVHAVRLALMDLVREGILYQVYGDKYGINQFRLDPAFEANAELAANHRAAVYGVGLIGEYPGHFDDKKLFDKLRSNGHNLINLPGFRVALYDAANKGLIALDNDGLWIPARPQQKI